MYCTKCGTKNDDKATFCYSCGEKLKNGTEEKTSSEKPKKKGSKKALKIAIVILLMVITVAAVAAAVVISNNNRYKQSSQSYGDITQTYGTQTPTEGSYTQKQVAPSLEKVSPADRYPTEASGEFQSIVDFCGDCLEFKTPKNEGGHYYLTFRGGEDALSVLHEYCDLLEEDGMYLRKITDEEDDWRSTSFSSYSTTKMRYWYRASYSYTGTGNVRNSLSIKVDNEEESGCIYISFTLDKYGAVEGGISYFITMEPTDFGYREGNTLEDITPSGPSAHAALIRTAKGDYETDDGRLSVSPGEATVIESGSKDTFRAEYVPGDETHYIAVYDSRDNLLTAAALDDDCLNTGAIYTDNALALSGGSHSAALGFNRPNPVIFRYAEGKFYSPAYSDSLYDAATLRTMYYNEAEDIAVFYIYSEFLTEQEILCAVRLSEAVDDDDDDDDSPFRLSDDEDDDDDDRCSYCRNRGFTDCLTCDDGEIEYYDHDGLGIGSQGIRRTKKCTSPGCVNGRKDCPYCDN